MLHLEIISLISAVLLQQIHLYIRFLLTRLWGFLVGFPEIVNTVALSSLNLFHPGHNVGLICLLLSGPLWPETRPELSLQIQKDHLP